MSNGKFKFSRNEWESKIIAHAWKDHNFKKLLLKDPKAALKEFHVEGSEKFQVKVVEEKDNEWVLVLPKTPLETQKISEEQLLNLAAGKGCTTMAGCPGQDRGLK